MSYILEALRKSERQRREAEAQPLAQLAAYPADTPRSHWRSVLLAIFAILNLGVLAFVLHYSLKREEPIGRTLGSAPGSEAQDMASRTAAAALSSDRLGPAGEPLGFAAAPTAPKPQTVTKELAGPRPKKPRESAAPPRSAAPPHRPVTAASPERTRRVPSPPGEGETARGPVPEGDPMGRLRRVDPGSTSPSVASGRSARPRVAEPVTSTLVDDHLPRPRINVYAYSATAERDRFVVIGGRKYHEGDRLHDGPAIRRIEESAVTLDFEGQTYKVPRP
ncbi:general secretion pathway protein GspB [Methylolobus aquaticus]